MATGTALPFELPPLQLSAEGERLLQAYWDKFCEITRLLDAKQFGDALARFRSLRNVLQECREHFISIGVDDDGGASRDALGGTTADPPFVFRILECQFFVLLARAKRMWNIQLMGDPDLRGRLGIMGLLDSWVVFDEQVTAARRERLGSEECHHVFPTGSASVLSVMTLSEGQSIPTTVEMAAQIRLGRYGFLRSEVAADQARARHLAEAMWHEDPDRLWPLFDVLNAEAEGAESTEDGLQKLRRRVELAEAVVLRDKYPGGGNFEAWLANGELEEGRTKRTASSRPLLPYGSPSGTRDVDVARGGLTYAGETCDHLCEYESKVRWCVCERVRFAYGYLHWHDLVMAYNELASVLEGQGDAAQREFLFLVDKAWKCQQKFSFVWDAFALLKNVEIQKSILALGGQGLREAGKLSEELAMEYVQAFAESVEGRRPSPGKIAVDLQLLSRTAIKNARRCFVLGTEILLSLRGVDAGAALQLAPLPKGPGELPPGTIPDLVESKANPEELFIYGKVNLGIALLAARTGKHWELERACNKMRLRYLDDREAASDLTRVLPTHRGGYSLEVRGGRLFLEGDECPICGEDVFVSVDDKWDEVLKPLRSLTGEDAGASGAGTLRGGTENGRDRSTGRLFADGGQKARDGVSTGKGTKAVLASASAKERKETQKQKRERQARERVAAKSVAVKGHLSWMEEILLSESVNTNDPIGSALQRRSGIVANCAHGIHKRCKFVAGALLTFSPTSCHICSKRTTASSSQCCWFSQPTRGWSAVGLASPFVDPDGSNAASVVVGAISGLEERYDEMLRRAGMVVHDVDRSSSAVDQRAGFVPVVADKEMDSTTHSLLAGTSCRLQRNATLALGHCVFHLELDTGGPLDRGQTRVIATERIKKGEIIYQELPLIEINDTDPHPDAITSKAAGKLMELPDHIKSSFLELHDCKRKYANELHHQDFSPLCAPDNFRELFPNFQFAQLAKILTQNHGATRFSTIGKTIMGVFLSNSRTQRHGKWRRSVLDFSARVRHSCRANAMVRAHSPNPPFHAIVALRDIAVGEEICISQLDEESDFHLAPAQQRVEMLKEDLLNECRADGCVCRGLTERGNQETEVARSDERCKQIRSLVAEFERAVDSLRLAVTNGMDEEGDEEGASGSWFGSEDCESQLQRAEELVERISAECDAERLSLPERILKYRMQLAQLCFYVMIGWMEIQRRGAVRPSEGEGGAMSFAEGLKVRFNAQIEKVEECLTLFEGPAPSEGVGGEGGDRDSIEGVVGPVTEYMRKMVADCEKKWSDFGEISPRVEGFGR